MNDLDRVADLLTSSLREQAPTYPPDRLVPESLRAVRHTRRPPRWFILARVSPMRTAGRVVVGSPAMRAAYLGLMTCFLALVAISVVLAGASLLGNVGLSAPRVIVVDQNGAGDVRTLADGIALARDNDQVLIMPGTYVETVEVTKNIMISGSGIREEIVIQAPPGGPTAAIDAAGDQDPYAMRLVDMWGTLSGVTFSGQASRLHVWGGSPQLQDLLFEEVGERYVPLSDEPTGAALVLAGGTTATLVNSRLFGGGPIGIFDGSEPRIIANHLRDGPHIWGGMGDGAVISGNNISFTPDRAIGIFYVTRARIENNTINNAGGDGITVGWDTAVGTDPIVRGNTISRSATGINVVGLDALPTVEGNVLTGNSIGISVARSNASIVGNDISDSVIGISIQAGEPALASNQLCGNATDLTIPTGSGLTLVGNDVCAPASPQP